MSTEIKEVVDKIGREWEDYKAENDKRLEKLEANEGVAEIREKQERMDEGLDLLNSVKERLEDLETKANRLDGGPTEEEVKKQEYRDAFFDYMKYGDKSELWQKAVNVTTGADGEHAVPEIIDSQVYQLLRDANPMRQACAVKTVPADYKELVNEGGAAVGGWGGETQAPSETATPTLVELAPKLAELWCEPRTTQWALEDMTVVDAEAWLSSEVAISFAERENLDFTTGDNTGNTPQGLFTATSATTDDDVRAFGTFQHKLMASSSAVTSDELIDTVYSLRTVYRNAGSAWMMNRLTQRDIRKLKDVDNDYLWKPGIAEGQPPTLLAYPIVENEDAPDFGVNNVIATFGVHDRAYVIADRRGMRVVRDGLTAKPYVKFWTTKRTGSYVRDTNALKFLKCAAV